MRSRLPASLLKITLIVFSIVGIGTLLLLAACSTSSTSTQSSGTGFLWLTAQGNTTLSAYTTNLGSGAISANGNAAGTGPAPAALVVAPNGSAIFVANSGSDPGTISSYTVNSNGTVTAAGQVTENPPALAPMGLAMDSAGKFLFVANQGSFDLSEPGSISVFSVNGTTLTEIAGSPFLDESVSATQGSGPVALAVNPAGGTLYAANQFTGTVSEFSIDPNSGALTLLSALDQGVGSSPSGLLAVKTSSASFLYVMNTGSNNITAFTINGDGSLTGI
ncbi:MAG: beta-propeller fold lactonase family protein, partial [Acidobacteriales bacterium]|nr:beta-propeller fold lactonase family protein [Terriglobales bacterium]